MKYLTPFFLFLLLIAVSCQSDKGTNQTVTNSGASVVNLNPQEFSKLGSTGNILDVRTPGEIAQGKIEGAIEIDYYQPDFQKKVQELPKDKPVLLYCAVGARSREAAEQLVEMGFTNVYHLQGGIQAWYQQGLPIVRE
ncbi:rhodanese-like domain-containing protein [Algoriphagus limi]|uniref:Rhodanese-like domain-containing protein n=1 Tax=Algoriphagus limi TaxID=2975273 RepID=A0ABT2G8T7_9BACT|nr:rhodanese-like domain-containing protein [Algoriphagus limi]MCS5491651.1 rhodanese-like domain-containing protein [Algoriphagus limi]